MVAVSGEGSVADAPWLEARIDHRFGSSADTNIIGALILGQTMAWRGETSTIALLGCDSGERYRDTIYDENFCRMYSLTGGGWTHLLGRLSEASFPAVY